MEAMRLPRGTLNSWRNAAAGHRKPANKAARLVPLQTARLCLETIALADLAARKGQQEFRVRCRRGGPGPAAGRRRRRAERF